MYPSLRTISVTNKVNFKSLYSVQLHNWILFVSEVFPRNFITLEFEQNSPQKSMFFKIENFFGRDNSIQFRIKF